MEDSEWLAGMRELEVSFPPTDLTVAMAATRGDVYRRELDHLSPERWVFAVRESIRQERWYPPVAVLLEYAEAAPSTQKALPPPRMTDAERGQARDLAKRGLAMCREAVRRALGEEPGEVVKAMPGTGEEA